MPAIIWAMNPALGVTDLTHRIEASRSFPGVRLSWGYHVRVSARHRYLCMTVPKVACTTVKRTLHALEGLDTVHDDEDVHEQGVDLRMEHWPSSEIAQVLLSSDWLRFGFVRNPYHRILSAWKSKVVDRRDAYYEDFRAGLRSAYGYSQVERAAQPAPPFRQFVEYVFTSTDLEIIHDGHWDLQTNVLLYDLIPYDTVGRFESFPEDFVRLLRQLDAPPRTIRIAGEVTNASGSGPARAEVYDAQLADVVYQRYERDFETFGYDRHSWR